MCVMFLWFKNKAVSPLFSHGGYSGGKNESGRYKLSVPQGQKISSSFSNT